MLKINENYTSLESIFTHFYCFFDLIFIFIKKKSKEKEEEKNHRSLLAKKAQKYRSERKKEKS